MRSAPSDLPTTIGKPIIDARLLNGPCAVSARHIAWVGATLPLGYIARGMGELGSMGHWFAPERYETPDFVLRSYDAGDGPLVAAATRESYEHLRPWMSWATEEQSVDDAEILARRFRAKYLTNEDFLIGAFSRDGAQLLGGTGFHLREGPLSGGCAEIGMWVRASEAGRGLGTRLLGAMLSWGFSEWPWLRLAWRCDDRNRASMRVAEKCGLRLEGLLRGQAAEVGGGRRDTATFAITRDEWLARQPPSPAR